jgi:hypothetical protein
MRHRAALVAALALVPGSYASAAPLGMVTQGTENYTLVSSCAFVPRYDTQGWGKPELTLLLSDKPIDCAAAQGWASPESGAFDEVVHRGRGALLSVSYMPGLKLGKVSYYAVGATLGNDDCEGCVTTLAEGGKGLKGALKTSKPLMLNDTPITFDVTIDLPKPAPPAAGEKLAGGGDPGKVYLAYLKAHQDGDYAALQKLMPDGEAEDDWGYYEEPERTKAIQGEKKSSSATVLEGIRLGDSALLVVEIDHPWQPGRKAKAAIGLGLQGGTWRVREEKVDMGGSMFK